MNQDQSTMALVVICLALSLLITTLYKRLAARTLKGPTLLVEINARGLQKIKNIRQRCEHKNEREVIDRALALYDLATESVQMGKKIRIGDEELDLFPIDME